MNTSTPQWPDRLMSANVMFRVEIALVLGLAMAIGCSTTTSQPKKTSSSKPSESTASNATSSTPSSINTVSLKDTVVVGEYHIRYGLNQVYFGHGDNINSGLARAHWYVANPTSKHQIMNVESLTFLPNHCNNTPTGHHTIKPLSVMALSSDQHAKVHNRTITIAPKSTASITWTHHKIRLHRHCGAYLIKLKPSGKTLNSFKMPIQFIREFDAP